MRNHLHLSAMSCDSLCPRALCLGLKDLKRGSVLRTWVAWDDLCGLGCHRDELSSSALMVCMSFSILVMVGDSHEALYHVAFCLKESSAHRKENYGA
jgi:hypothetical protein